MTNPLDLDAVGQAALLRKGEVSPVELVDAARHRSVDGLGVARRPGDRDDVPAERRERGLGLGQLVGLAGQHPDRGAGAHVGLGDRAADAASSAGDERDPAFETERGGGVDHAGVWAGG